jgi:hypothetical protein
MRNITSVDQIRHTPHMKYLSIKTSVHPLGSGFLNLKREKNILETMRENKNPFLKGSGVDLAHDPLRGGSFLGDVLKVAGVFDPTGLVRTASFVVK